ncbi:hypothetical protein BDN72DRAFT_748952, partial [Pluteus cervinus]
ILDSKGRVIAGLAGRPHNDPTWDASIGRTTLRVSNMRKESKKSRRNTPAPYNRRGNYVTMTGGVSFGGGQTQPRNLSMSPTEQRLVDAALEDRDVRRVMGFQSSVFQFFAPRLFRQIEDSLNQLYIHYPQLKRNFIRSVYPAISFNCGPQTTTKPHVDHGNAPNSFCAITALGNFNPDNGGHLILFPLNLVVRFPPGSTIVIPSSTIEHGNTPIAANE